MHRTITRKLFNDTLKKDFEKFKNMATPSNEKNLNIDLGFLNLNKEATFERNQTQQTLEKMEKLLNKIRSPNSNSVRPEKLMKSAELKRP